MKCLIGLIQNSRGLRILTALLIVLVLVGCSSQKVRSVIEMIESLQIRKMKIVTDWAETAGKSPRFYGVEFSWIDQESDLYLERYQRLHPNVVRVQISQDLFDTIASNDESRGSTIDFSRVVMLDPPSGNTMTYQSMFQSLAAKFPDMYFQINIWLAAKWNATNSNGYMGLGGAFPPKDYAVHRRFVRALADWLVYTCGIKPEQLSFTFINEPNLRSFFVGESADLIRMAVETRTALDEISPLIQMGGLDEVHGTSWTDAFYAQRPARCCDLWTFHVYERGIPAMLNALSNRTRQLGRYGPVWITEFADTANGSPDGRMDFSTRVAALGIAEMLGRLWGSGVDGIIHFRFADTYASTYGGWVGHGLFADAHGTHAGGKPYDFFPAYWVLANMYRELGGSQVVRAIAPSELAVVAARKAKGDSEQLAIWVTNSTAANYVSDIELAHFPTRTASLEIYDNLVGDTPIEIHPITDTALIRELSLPGKSSRLLIFRPSITALPVP